MVPGTSYMFLVFRRKKAVCVGGGSRIQFSGPPWWNHMKGVCGGDTSITFHTAFNR